MVRGFHRFFSRFTLSCLLILATIFNSIAPAFLLATPVMAADSSPSVSYGADAHDFTLSGPTGANYYLYYQTPTKMDGVQGTLPATVYAGTKSAGVGTPETVERGIFKTGTTAQYFVVDGSTLRLVATPTSSSLDLTASETAWLADPATYGDLVTGATYHAPFNQDVSVSFTSLPATPGTITFHEITLTDAQVKESGALTSTAYEITSTMSDGSFTYNLTLPNPSQKTNVGVQYSEDGKTFTSAASVSAVPSIVTIPGLTHFTIFVVTNLQPNYAAPGGGGVYSAYYGPNNGYVAGSPGTTTIYDGREAGIIKAGLTIDPNDHVYEDEGLFGFQLTDTINNFASQTLSYDVQNQYGTLPVWMTIEIDTGVIGDRSDNTTYQFVPTSNPTGWHTVNAAAGMWQKWNNMSGDTTGNPLVSLGTLATEYSGLNVVRAYLRLGMGNAYHDNSNGTVAWVSQAIFGGQTFNFATMPACNAGSFDTSTLGSVNGQNGWSITGSYDQAVVDNVYGYPSFGCKTLRISDSITSGSFGDQIFAPPTANGAGETSATSGSFALGTRQNHYEAQFDIASAVPNAQQPGMHLSISPDRGDGSRMSYLNVVDGSSGLDVYFYDVQGTSNPANFVGTQIASGLDRTIPHTFKFVMDFVEGPSNDVVKVYVDGSLVHTGTSWENYYRYDSEASAEPSPRIVKTVLFRESGTATSADSGKGFLIDNFSDSSSNVTPAVPNLVSPADGSHVQPTGLFLDWTDSDSLNLPVTYRYQSSYNPATGAHNSLSSPIYNANTGTVSQINASGSADHLYYWQVQACDSADNCSDWSGPWAVTIDGTAPTVPTNGTPNGTTIPTNNFDFNWNASSDISPITYEFQSSMNPTQVGGILTTGLWHSGVLPTNMIHSSGAPDGTWYWQVRAIDAAGNVSAWSPIWNVTLDTVAPVIPTATLTANSISVPPNGYTSSSTFTFNLSSSPDTTRYQLKYWNNITGSVYKIGTPWNPTNLSAYSSSLGVYNDHFSQGEGTHYFAFSACDAAGNCSTYSSPFVVTYDHTAPTVSLTAPVISLLRGSVDIRGSVQDANPDHYYTVITNSTNHVVAGPGTVSDTNSFVNKLLFTWNTLGVSDGTYTIDLEARDAAGNKNAGSVTTKTVTVDNTAPTSVITFPTNEGSGSTVYTNSWTGSIQGTATDNLSGVTGVNISIENSAGQYFDGESFVDSEGEILLPATYNSEGGTWYYDGLTSPGEGSYTLKSHATDLAGNVENTYTLTVVYDHTIPEVALATSPASPDGGNGWFVTNPTITLTATDVNNIQTIQYQWDSEAGAWTTYTAPFLTPGEGGHVLYYRAEDLADNWSDTGIKNIRYDATELTNGPQNVSVSPNPTSGTTATVKWDAATDNVGIDHYVVEWKLGDTFHSASVGSDVRSYTIDQLTAEGDWNVKVIAFDGEGHSKDASVTLTVDRTAPAAPTLTLTGAAAGSATLGWTAVAGASAYTLWYGTAPGNYIYGANVGNVTTYTVNGLGAGTYYFVVRAKDGAGNSSGNSNEVGTGAIAGAAGVAPGAPAAGFLPAPQVLGAQTVATPSASPSPESMGSVLGATTNNYLQALINNWWFWPLVVLLAVLLSLVLYLWFRRSHRT